MNMTYAGSGVNYDTLDEFKRQCQLAGAETSANISHRNHGEFREFQASRGESAFLIETDNSYIAHVEEGLGTKNLVADAMFALTGISYEANIAQDAVAMIVNDMITVGAMPVSIAMHLAVGDSDWFKNQYRVSELVIGWTKACKLARCVWGGGETPTLKNVINPKAYVLSGSAIGVIKPKIRRIDSEAIRFGDAIVFVESTGVHANGLTLARDLADRLGMGYSTVLTSMRSYGETLLEPTHIYVGLVEDCLNRGVDIHYAVNITGHGWRKLMRATKPFTYVITRLPQQLTIFDTIQKYGRITDEEAYGTFNMGAGFALYVPETDVNEVCKVARCLGFTAFRAGYIKAGEKKVIIEPKDITFDAKTMLIR